MTQNMLDIHDSEVKKALDLLAELNERAKAKKHNYNDFEREIRDRFAALGLAVDVNWYRFSLDGIEQDGAMPEITVTGRVSGAPEWDPDRQVHEVVNNILELPGQTKGEWIKTDPETYRRFREGHDHGHGHS